MPLLISLYFRKLFVLSLGATQGNACDDKYSGLANACPSSRLVIPGAEKSYCSLEKKSYASPLGGSVELLSHLYTTLYKTVCIEDA